ncbi:Hvo_1808 family surface protein [Salinirussus salinus]|uniref:Hvo_1808 family surface protein n=1 Tax=Salinirussus salinus TaxID=1198300 RepID=UPI0013582387|nr:Hvo_1808 family surface protein [Salinirussus salinus]
MRRAAVLTLALAALAVLAGCGAVGPADDGELGVENGYSYDDDLSVTTEDGLNGTELTAVKSRAMARLERLRGLEFTEDVPVRVITREQYRANATSTPNRTHQLWNNQVWEGLFLVGEDRNVSAVFDDLRGSTVQGYYSPGRDEIVIVSDSATPRLRRGTLVHELVHALQDQQFGLDESMDTQDRQLAHSAVVEGEANLLTARYQGRCDGEWSCVTVPGGGGGGGSLSNPGVFVVLYQPYASGPGFVAAIEGRGGWDAVDDLHEAYPASTEQVIHPERYPDDEPVDVSVPDRSSAAWDRFDHDPVADTVGEASVYAMLVANGVGETPPSRYSYSHPAADGWAGDALVPYRSGGEYGYVWETAWENPGEAREFHDAYRELLEKRGAVSRGDGVWVIPEGAFADAFRVTREGSRVRVVNAPTAGSLDGVHAE